MSEKITVRWEIAGQGESEIYADELDALTEDAIYNYAVAGAVLEVIEQGEYEIRIRGVTEALRRLKERDDDR